MHEDSVTLRVDGNDIVLSISALEQDYSAPITSGLVVKYNIQRNSDDYWWDGASWVTGSEPSLLTATQKGSTGIYEYRLVGGFDGDDSIFFVHINAVGVINQDFYVVLVPYSTAIDSSSTISTSISLSSTVDAKVNSLDKLIKRIFSDQRDHKQIIEKLIKQISKENKYYGNQRK